MAWNFALPTLLKSYMLFKLSILRQLEMENKPIRITCQAKNTYLNIFFPEMDNYVERLKKIVQEKAGGKYTVFAKNAGIAAST